MSTPHQHDTTIADVADIVRRFYEPFRTGDASIYDEVLAQDWIDVPLAPGQQQGPAGAPGHRAWN